MSAVFHIKYRGGFLRFEGRRVNRTDARNATPFTSEADALLKAHQLKLDPDFLEVVPANQTTKEVA